jgi:hypothetical protein
MKELNKNFEQIEISEKEEEEIIKNFEETEKQDEYEDIKINMENIKDLVDFETNEKDEKDEKDDESSCLCASKFKRPSISFELDMETEIGSNDENWTLLDMNTSINCSEIAVSWFLKCNKCDKKWSFTEIEDNNTEGSPIFQETEWKLVQ